MRGCLLLILFLSGFVCFGQDAILKGRVIDANSAQAGSAEANAYKYAELTCGEDGKKAEKKAERKEAKKAAKKAAKETEA